MTHDGSYYGERKYCQYFSIFASLKAIGKNSSSGRYINSQKKTKNNVSLLRILSSEARFAGKRFSLNKAGIKPAFAAMNYSAEDAVFDR
jgi:hypothetical protein